MSPADPRQPPKLAHAAARAGHLASVAVVFACGWFAMRSDDWRRIALFTALAAVAGLVAAGFARQAR